MHVGPPARPGHLNLRTLASYLEPEVRQNFPADCLLDFQTGEARNATKIESERHPALRRCAGNSPLRRLPAGELQDEIGCVIEAGHDIGRINAALEPIARIGLHARLAAGRGCAHGIEVGALDEDVGGLLGAGAALTADDAAETQRTAVVGDHAHGLVDLVLLAVERQETLARTAEPGPNGALELVGIVDVERAAAVE